MIVVSSAVYVVAGALALTVGGQCGRNMIQTARIIAQHQSHSSKSQSAIMVADNLLSLPSLSSLTTTTTTTNNVNEDNNGVNDTEMMMTTTTTAIVDVIKKMNREQLLQLFLEGSTAPTSETELYGDWDGCLLDNNSPFMTTVTSFITNILFAGRMTSSSFSSSSRTVWNGKSFLPKTGTLNNQRRGINRFRQTTTTTTPTELVAQQASIHDQDDTCTNNGSNGTGNAGASASFVAYQKHDFDYSLEESSFIQSSRQTKDGKIDDDNVDNSDTNSNNSNKSMCLNYSNYRSTPLSLWYTMKDEVRFVNVPMPIPTIPGQQKQQQQSILIGLGSMLWSGGKLNCSPFLLWRVAE